MILFSLGNHTFPTLYDLDWAIFHEILLDSQWLKTTQFRVLSSLVTVINSKHMTKQANKSFL